jgi:hypothetical protein
MSCHYGGRRAASVALVSNRSVLFELACSRVGVSYLDGMPDH